jgi:uncharacterized protein YqjF (DUF2071 family)
MDSVRLAILGALAASRVGMEQADVLRALDAAGVDAGSAGRVLAALVSSGGVRARSDAWLELTPSGILDLLALHAEIEHALDPSPPLPEQEQCPSVPWLTAVQTCWIDALSINYRVDPLALAPLLPAPLEPEVHKGHGWVQVLMSSLRDMRPPGIPSLFGTCFYQVSYRAAVRYRDGGGAWRRGGYFVRSETNHPVMRAVGNALAEFKFHDFGAADMVMLRDGDRLTVGVDPEPGSPDGKLVSVVDTRPRDTPPAGSCWSSLDELHEPLVECYDALGVDAEQGHLYILTIDRDPWNARFVSPQNVYCEYFDTGPLGRGAGELDSVLHLEECRYRWRPLRRVALG